MRSKARAGRFAALALVVVACGDGERAGTAPTVANDARNVLFLCVDTLRDDHLSGSGYRLQTSPNLDALAARGTRFRHCFSTYPQTAASVASIFTSLYPTAHKVRPEEMLLSAEPALLADTFRRAGYRTAAVASNPHLTPGLGFERGFERFYYIHGKDVKKSSYGEGDVRRDVDVVFRASDATFYGRADAINAAALEWLDELDGTQPFYLYLHYMDVHSPYKSPGGFQRRFVERGGKNIYRNGLPTKTIGRNDVAFTRALYDGGISYADHMLSEVLREMDGRGLLENTFIVFVSDHGEEFMEHGGFGHGKTLHRELVDVPLFLVGPGIRAQEIDRVVSTIDLFPTLCELTGLPAPTGVQGESLAPLLRGEAAPRATRFVLSECGEARIADDNEEQEVERFALADDEWRLIHCPELGLSELYRYRIDTAEKHDLAAQEPERVARMVAEAERLLAIARVLGESIESGKAELDADALDELNGLGYGGE